MSAIGRRDTKIEVVIRSELHRTGFRFRKDVRGLPGRPDVVLPKYRAAIFVNGCFWHGHDCHLFKWPKSNSEFWQQKILGNVERDKRNAEQLSDMGWRVLLFWECSLRQQKPDSIGQTLNFVKEWIAGESSHAEIRGH